jgi:hypothetical protein
VIEGRAGSRSETLAPAAERSGEDAGNQGRGDKNGGSEFGKHSELVINESCLKEKVAW